MRSTTLIFRTFEKTDARAVVKLYNECFQSYRTFQEWDWMYLQMPDFDPSGILVTEDREYGEIVGSLVACKHPVSINGDKHIVGVIDDVDTSHKWRGRGIATKLMGMAIDECRSQDCSALFLYANPFGEAISIYRRLGFKDAENFFYNGKMYGFRSAARNLPFPMNLASPLATVLSSTRSRRCRISKTQTAPRQLDCTNNRQLRAYLEALNSSLQSVSLFYPYSHERLTWMLCKAPKSIGSVSRFIEESGRILCGANASIYRMRFLGKIFNSWVISDVFASKDLRGAKKEAYIHCLIERLTQDGQERSCVLQMTPLSQHDKEMSRLLKPSGFFRFVPTTLMCLALTSGFSLPSKETPWYYWKQHMVGVP